MTTTDLANGRDAGKVAPESRSQSGAKRRRQEATSLAPRLIGLGDAAVYCGLSYWAIRDLTQSGKIPVVKVPDVRRILIDRADLDRLIEQWKEHP